MVMVEKHVMHCLLVEDNEAHADLIRICMGQDALASQLDHVTDGPSALAYLRQEGAYANTTRPDVVVLDLKLPGMNGHEILAEIRRDESIANIPVVILTTSASADDRDKAYRLRANSYLTKPADFGEMREMVRDLSKYWARWNQPPSEAFSGGTGTPETTVANSAGDPLTMFVNTVGISRESLDVLLDTADAKIAEPLAEDGRTLCRTPCRIYDLPMTIHHRDAHVANHLVVTRNLSSEGLAFVHRGAVRTGSTVVIRLPEVDEPITGRTVYYAPLEGILNQIGVAFETRLPDDVVQRVLAAAHGGSR